MQTTYENFRYRYDKKVNPYNRGIIKNFREVFFSRIPPSMHDFRAFVQEDEIISEPTDHNFMECLSSTKEKIDIEMGSKLGEGNSFTLPEILQCVDEYGEIEENLKQQHNEVSERTGSESDRLIVEAGANDEDNLDDIKSEQIASSVRA